MTVRDERAAALIRRHRDLSDDFTRALPGLLDDLEAIDAAHAVPTGVIKVEGEMTEAEAALLAREMARTTAAAADLVRHPGAAAAPTDAQIAAWIDANPQKFEAWVRKQNRINGAPPPFAAPAKPATRRRTGGTHA